MTASSSARRSGSPGSRCRGAWARVTIHHFRHLVMQIFIGHGVLFKTVFDKMLKIRRDSYSTQSEKDAVSAQKSGQLQPFIAVISLECMGRLASFGPT
jgi:hypothetical protein